MDLVKIAFNDGTVDMAELEERVYADRSCGQMEGGWMVFIMSTEYFVSESGDVWRQPENEVVGVAPKIKEDADRWEAIMAQGEDLTD